LTNENEIIYDKSLLGVEYHAGIFHVTKKMIKKFCKAAGESNPLFTDEKRAGDSEYGGIIAPPTFCNIFTSGIKRPDTKVQFGDVVYFAGQAVDWLAAIRPGDELTVSTKLKDVYAKTGRSGKMVFEVWETSFKNQHGEIVNLVRESTVRRNRKV